MKYNYEIDYIRNLLDKYFRAETSPEEEEVLENFFSYVNDVDLPADLKANQALFTVMKELHTVPDDNDVPRSLSENIEKIVAVPTINRDEKRKNKLFYFSPYIEIGIAACIAVIIGIVCLIPDRHDATLINDKTASSNQLSDTSLVPNLPIIVQEPKKIEEPLLVDNKDNDLKELPPTHVKKTVSVPAYPVSDPEENDGFFEVTDLEAAHDILLKIGNLLACNAELSQDVIDNIDKSLENNIETSKSPENENL